MNDHVVIYITSGSEEEADNLASGLVENSLAACVNIVPAVKSVYKWKGEICKDDEFLLIAKSRKSLMREVIEWVKKNHSYENPEVIALPVIDGPKEYLRWVDDSCQDLTGNGRTN